MPKRAVAVPPDLAGRSPQLPDLVLVPQTIDEDVYPLARELMSVAVAEDWIVKAEDALTEARNGVTAISWPFALAALLGFLAMLADVADSAPNVWLAIAASPWKSLVCGLLFVATIAAFKLSDETSDRRQKLVAIRSAYLRRRRELSDGNRTPPAPLPDRSNQ